MEHSASHILGPDGALAKQIDNFAVRTSQQTMAAIIDEHIAERGSVVIEAGTGIGKTFAYLVPALLSGLKVIISTGTKTLQEQLFLRDLPLVKRALEIPASLALLKGRTNYLCLHRLHTERQSAANLHPYLVNDIEEAYNWSKQTQTGDIAELSEVSEKSNVWPLITSTVDNCLNIQCSYYDDCYLLKARREAHSADILVINHHLLMADMQLKEEGFGELLPGADAIIVDEAHQLPEVATLFFGQSLTQRQILEFIEETENEIRLLELQAAQYRLQTSGASSSVDNTTKLSSDVKSNETPSGKSKRKLLVALKQALAVHYRLLPSRVSRYLCSELKSIKQVVASLESLVSCLTDIRDWLVSIQNPSKNIDHCSNRCYFLGAQIEQVIVSIKSQQHNEDESSDASENNERESVAWLERSSSSFSWHISPIDISSEYQKKAAAYNSSWIYTSATLAIGDSFQHFIDRLGIEPDKTAQIDSPFNYQEQALLYLPKDLPEPNTSGYDRAVMQLAETLINQCSGGIFLLFTSHRALNTAADFLAPNLNRTLLVQGQAPRTDLLFRFQELGNAVLLGTSSFWQGVDVRGKALSCVIIDKLPFASPADPLVQAKMEFCRSRGQNPFMSFQLPEAIISLKQGVGRLIRDYQDYGLMVLCDPRLKSKPYGKKFLASLPPMKITDSIDEARSFLVNLDEDNVTEAISNELNPAESNPIESIPDESIPDESTPDESKLDKPPLNVQKK